MENQQPTVNGQPINQHNNQYNNSLPPKNYLVESILVTIFCCLPFGIAGIINAAKVEGLFHAGNIQAAQKAAADAKKWTMWGLISGLVVIVLYLIFYFAVIAAAVANGNFE